MPDRTRDEAWIFAQENRGLVYMVLNRFVRQVTGKAAVGELRDELESEAWIAMLKAAETFDPNKASFSTWAVRNIWQDLIKAYGRWARQKPLEAVSLEGVIEHIRRARDSDSGAEITLEALSEPDFSDELVEHLDDDQMIAQLRATIDDGVLGPVERDIIKARLAGETLAEIAFQRGVTAQAIHCRVRRIIRKLQEALA